ATSPLAFSTKILKDLTTSNSAKTYTRDAAIEKSYDTSCSRRALRFAQPSDLTTTAAAAVTTPTFGLAVELSDTAKNAILTAFEDTSAPLALKGISLGFMHKPLLPATSKSGAKFPIFGFGHLPITEADKLKERLNGIYWTQKDYSEIKRWALCLKLFGREDVCVSTTLANDNNIASIVPEKTFVALTLSRYPGTQDASDTVYISLYANGKIAFFDGSESRTAIEVSVKEARDILSGITRFVVGANLEQTAHADADYNAWFALDRPLTADEIRTVAQSIDGSIIPATGRAGTTPLNKILLKVTTDGGTISGSGIPTCDANKEVTATFTPGTALTLRANPKSGYTFKSWSGDCSGITEDCTFSNIRSDKTVSAAFDPKQAKIKIVATNGGATAISSKHIPNLFCSGQTCGDVSFDANETIKLTATPNEGYEFNGWTGNLCADANSADCTIFIDPAIWDFSTTKTLQASFATKKYTLTTTVNSATQIIAPDFAGQIKLDDVVITT
ncbi:MAG: hypothetical protein EBU49_10445, partial [Proteobacteria bacterium]|nr:hypothetical protein [Pseudomonadota bacterium]